MYQKTAVSREKISKTFLLLSNLQFTALTAKAQPLSRTLLFTSLFFIIAWCYFVSGTAIAQ
jgi:hypothetical protein